MTWDVISRALFPAGDGGLLLMAVYWSVLAGLVGLEFFSLDIKIKTASSGGKQISGWVVSIWRLFLWRRFQGFSQPYGPRETELVS